MYPASKNSTIGIVLVTSVFGVSNDCDNAEYCHTFYLWGQTSYPWDDWNGIHMPLAGATIFLCGITIRFLGL